jgi:hypothetical protein
MTVGSSDSLGHSFGYTDYNFFSDDDSGIEIICFFFFLLFCVVIKLG